jgi:hypothetical protein
MIPFAAAVDTYLTRLVEYTFEQLEGVPEMDLNAWKPRQELEDINTFYALALHTVSAGEYWLLHGAGGQSTDRNREAEFRSSGTLTALKTWYEPWLSDSRDVLGSLTDLDLAREVKVRDRPDEVFTVADCIVHTVEHTATHVGHLQIQRQLWDAEQER